MLVTPLRRFFSVQLASPKPIQKKRRHELILVSLTVFTTWPRLIYSRLPSRLPYGKLEGPVLNLSPMALSQVSVIEQKQSGMQVFCY